MEPHPHLSSRELTLLALSLLIISLGLLMFEIALTRVFSVMLAYHYVFIAVSVALLGLGIGAVFFRFIRGRMLAERSFSALCKLSLIFALSIPLATTLVLKIPYTDFLAVYYGITFIPFFFAGMIFALAFDRFTEHSSKLYCASLIGSGIGPLAVIFALESFGGVNTTLLVGAISAIGAVAVALGSGKRKLVASSLIGLLLLSALFATNLGGNYIGEISSESPHKELFTVLNDPQYEARITRTYWSAYARTDLVELGSDPSVKLIFNDGGAGTLMYQFDGENFDSVGFLKYRTEFFPFYFGDKDNVLIIGPGGGKEVLISLIGGAKTITAVEVNPDIVRIVREESGFNGGIYYHENVRWIVDEGRSFIKRSADDYNIIMFVDILTKSARELVGYSLTESYIFTVEAFEDYLDHLTENGRLVIVSHHEIEATRIFAIGISALNRRGKTTSEATRHMILLKRPTHPSWPVFILKKTPLSENESIEMYDKAQELGFQPIYFPHVYETQLFEPLVTGQMSLGEWVTMIEPYDLSPTTDDSPFFYNYGEKGLPSPLSSVFFGVLLLTSLFVIAAWLSLEYFVKYGRKTDNTKTIPQKTGSFNFVLFFLLLGLGFMLIEVALVQKFILFLGQPTLAFSVLLFSLLVGGGVGSLFSDRFKGDLARKVILVSLFIGVLVTIYAAGLPYVFDQFLGYEAAVRSMISAALLFPLGFLMGMPFPTGLKIFKQFFERDVGWVWGVNGVASVLGSVLAVVIAILSGFTAALVFGAAMYLCVGLISHRLHAK
jgi:MFS family permease